MTATGTLVRTDGSMISFKEPSLISSRTLLSGTSAIPKCVSTKRFCAVRLSMIVTGAPSRPAEINRR